MLFAERFSQAGFSGPSMSVVPRNVSSACIGFPSGPFMMARLENPRAFWYKLTAAGISETVSMADTALYCFLLRGSIFFAMVLLSQGSYFSGEEYSRASRFPDPKLGPL